MSRITNYLELSKYYAILALSSWKTRNVNVINNRVVFITFDCEYSCNPKYICSELLKTGKYEIYWVISDNTHKNIFPPEIKFICGKDSNFYDILTSSKFVIFNAHVQQLGYFPKKKGQIYIQTWHGSNGLKKFDEKNDPLAYRIHAAKRTGKLTDYFIGCSKFEYEEVAPVYWKSAKYCNFGHPRNDILFAVTNSYKKRIKESIGLDCNKHYALFAPTYREDNYNYLPNIDFDAISKTLETKFGGNWAIIYKSHFNSASPKRLSGNSVIDLSDYVDIQEIMAISEVGITDYSSWIFDYYLTNQPCFLFVPDINKYTKTRTFYHNLEDLPFDYSTTEEELLRCINNYDPSKYIAKKIKFDNKIQDYNDGFASQRVVQLIEKIQDKY